jgi:hypothetical protein
VSPITTSWKVERTISRASPASATVSRSLLTDFLPRCCDRRQLGVRSEYYQRKGLIQGRGGMTGAISRYKGVAAVASATPRYKGAAAVASAKPRYKGVAAVASAKPRYKGGAAVASAKPRYRGCIDLVDIAHLSLPDNRNWVGGELAIRTY